MGKEKILVVEDEKDIQELILFNLESRGYRAEGVSSGEEALRKVSSEKPDLMILDLMLPGIDGFEVCRKLKQQDETRQIPILMLTARSDDSDVISGLEIGADDYMTKPFSPRVLVARVRTALRRKQDSGKEDSGKEKKQKIVEVHDIVIDVSRHEVSCQGKAVQLSATEFSILRFLAENPGWVFSRNQIIDAVKGENYPVTERSVDVQILGLRKKLGSQGQYIETVRGIGYRIK